MGIRASSVFLFGSRARGRPHLGSDVDLIVISPDFEGLSMLSRMETLGIAAGRVGAPIQSFGFTPEEIERDSVPPFLSEILKQEAVAV
jgi:predicted nucleotidyltransferase